MMRIVPFTNHAEQGKTLQSALIYIDPISWLVEGHRGHKYTNMDLMRVIIRTIMMAFFNPGADKKVGISMFSFLQGLASRPAEDKGTSRF